jgi:GNAT superfamily N-acetyltransferase
VFETCRTTSIKDPGFLQLLSQFLMEAGHPMPDKDALDRLEGAVRTDRIRFYMALAEGGRVVGVVSLTTSFSTRRMSPYGIVSDLYVHPGYRGRGAASALLLAAMDGAHASGCSYIVTENADGMEGVFDRVGWESKVGLMHYEVNLDAAPPSLTITGEITFD